VDLVDYIRTATCSDLADQLRHCQDELAGHLKTADDDYRQARAARADYHARLLSEP
jgi:hypothetical protein